MAMSLRDRIQVWKLLRGEYTPSDQPAPGNLAVFTDETGSIQDAGIVYKWPYILSPESESRALILGHAKSEPLASHKIRFYSPVAAKEPQLP